jgi:hypothetical protein
MASFLFLGFRESPRLAQLKSRGSAVESSTAATMARARLLSHRSQLNLARQRTLAGQGTPARQGRYIVAVRPLSPVIIEYLGRNSIFPSLHIPNRKSISQPRAATCFFSPALSYCHPPLSDRARDNDLLENMPRGACSARKDEDAQDAATPQEYP